MRSTRTETRRVGPALVVLNGVLLLLLAAVTFAPTAEGQIRNRGDYTMVAGTINGANPSVVYVVDAANQELIALLYNNSTKQLDGLGYRNLAVDAAEVIRGRTRSGS